MSVYQDKKKAEVARYVVARHAIHQRTKPRGAWTKAYMDAVAKYELSYATIVRYTNWHKAREKRRNE